jgi:lipid A ethanolaminephosphotransferase
LICLAWLGKQIAKLCNCEQPNPAYQLSSIFNPLFTKRPPDSCMQTTTTSPVVRHRTLPVDAFIVIYSLATSALYQWPLYMRASATLDQFDMAAALAMATLFALQMLVSVLAWSAVSLVSVRLMKVLCIVLLPCNAIALFFIQKYGVILDATMMGNIFNTHPAEAAELVQPQLFVYLFLGGLIPCVLIAKTTITKQSFTRRLGFMVLSTLIGILWIYANAKSWLWVDKHASQFGGLMLPWSYIANTARHYERTAAPNKAQVLLPDATISRPSKTVVVLVIGESARAANFSLLGYPRLTNPLLSKTSVIALPKSQSCATYTTRSLQCMLSHLGSSAPLSNTYEPLPSYLQRQGVKVMWRTNNFGEPPLKVSDYKTAGDIRKDCQGEACARLGNDEVLLHGLKDSLKNMDHNKALVVLHQTGSHGPLYFNKYPPEFNVFRPTCQTVDLSKCTQEELNNAYDNTILYTDFVLNQVIEMLQSLDNTEAVMLYASDHGESLGEYGLYLHGTPYSIAPDVQKNIPMMVWMSDKFVQNRGLAGKAIDKSITYSHDYLFHSVMGSMGLTSEIYKRDLDMFQHFQ